MYDGPELSHCIWVSDGVCAEDDDCACESTDITSVDDCFLITRIVTTTQDGTGLSNETKSETYLKPGFPIVKEDISILWESLDWHFPAPEYISKIEYKALEDPSEFSNSNNNFFDNNLIEINDMSNMPDFDYSPFKITPTMGFQRLELEFLNE